MLSYSTLAHSCLISHSFLSFGFTWSLFSNADDDVVEEKRFITVYLAKKALGYAIRQACKSCKS